MMSYFTKKKKLWFLIQNYDIVFEIV